MGGGYSGKFTGTTGAIGDQRHSQFTLFDNVPVRAKMDVIADCVTGGGGVVSERKMKQCYCCGSFTIPVGTENEVCLICGWIDDKYQNTHLSSLNGRDPICLKDAREAYKNGYESSH